MPARKPPPPDEKPQRERFIEAAREAGASEEPEEFERVFQKVVRRRDVTATSAPHPHRSEKQRAS